MRRWWNRPSSCDPRGAAARRLPAAALSLLVLVVTLLALTGSALAAASVPDSTITASFPSGEPSPPSVTATAAILIDADSGEILFSKNANARLPMASTTKIMTAIVALETLDLDQKVTVSAAAVSVEGSKASLVKGEVLTVDDLLHGLLIISGNDAAVALAEAAGGSVKGFVDMMNAKAKEMGLKNTHFVNPHGVQPKGADKDKHYSSAKDLAVMTQYAQKFAVFREIVDSESITLPAAPGQQKPRYWDHNGNELLMDVPWVTGVKTGSTPYAKYCLVASGTKDGISMISVVLGADNSTIRWKESRKLLELGFALRPRNVLVSNGEQVIDLDAGDVMARTVRLVAAKGLTVHLAKGDVVTRSVVIDRTPAVPVAAGEVFGHLQFTLAGRTLGTVDIIAAQPLTRPTPRMLVYYWRACSPVKLLPRM